MGLNVDEEIYALQIQGLDPIHQKIPFKKCFVRKQKEYIQNEAYTKDVEDSIHTLTQALESKQLQIRIVRSKNVHAKFYIFHSNPRISYTGGDSNYHGSLIVGSSNLTHNGLEKNYEFNLESRDSDDIGFAIEEFEKLWQDSLPLCLDDVLSAVKDTYLELRTPEEIYYKLLLCHFGESFLHTDTSIKDLFTSYKPYDYQIHAIQEGLEKLKKYDGFFLSDVVGLGKTLIASIIAKKLQVDSSLQGKILVVCPPALKNSWKTHFDNLSISRYEIATHDSLHNLLEQKKDFELIIVDESHRFRSSGSKRYENLEKICKSGDKKVILLSATPQNNSPQDIANQVYLFCDRRKSEIEGIANLEEFFSKRTKEFERIKKELKSLNPKGGFNHQKKREELRESLKKNSDILRNKLLSHIMIRRTRADIEVIYKSDMKAQKLTFPKITQPQDLEYNLDSSTHDLATQTILFLANNKENKSSLGDFGYHRYLIYPNLTQKGKKRYMESYDSQNSEFYEDTANRLSVLIQKILFKRFDSSIHAFKATLKSQIRSHNALIDMFERETIYIPKNYDNREKLYEAIESDDENVLQDFIDEKEDKFIALSPSDFKPDFLANLKHDKESLESVLQEWEQIKLDSKFERLWEFLQSHSSQKIVLFTEAKTTATYLHKQLEQKGFKYVLCVDSSNREQLEEQIRQNFDANYPVDKQKDDYSLIISTDTLAEGVNLHRSNIIINYDTPYNATKLMQRIGRINRIGTSFESIHIYNFKPTHLTDNIINIINISLQKLQSFHYTLGEDSAIYDEREEVQSQKLFSQVKELDKEQSPEPNTKKI
ncbi:helicase-related protein [uncultured Helicobacter sp.]|uniref:helicase-related protein n=1 Tax=uncultured Helicobacter sp. TaxID=175537 RepID=UPI00374E27F6